MTLENTIIFACNAHSGQKDKAGKPYILHPLRIMLQMEGEMEKQLALLHDVVEDCDISLQDLTRAGFIPELITAVDAITKRTSETHRDYLIRVLANPLALKVKLSDIMDNLMRMTPLDNKTRTRLMIKYRKAGDILGYNFYRCDNCSLTENLQIFTSPKSSVEEPSCPICLQSNLSAISEDGDWQTYSRL